MTDKIAKSWIKWFVEQLRSEYLTENVVSAMAFGMIFYDQAQYDFLYKGTIEILSHKYMVKIRNLREYVYRSLYQTAVGLRPIGIGIAFKDMDVVTGDPFGSDYTMLEGKGITVYFERFEKGAKPILYWLPDINYPEEKIAYGHIGWGKFIDYVFEQKNKNKLTEMLKSIGIASSAEPETWGGFDSYDDLLKHARGD